MFHGHSLSPPITRDRRRTCNLQIVGDHTEDFSVRIRSSQFLGSGPVDTDSQAHRLCASEEFVPQSFEPVQLVLRGRLSGSEPRPSKVQGLFLTLNYVLEREFNPPSSEQIMISFEESFASTPAS